MKNGLNRDDLVVIGHSLGAHIAGLAGKKLQKDYDITLRIILALDPARVLYDFDMHDNRLSVGDANYIQVIHTSDLGALIPLGNADFYVFGQGWMQQGGCIAPCM